MADVQDEIFVIRFKGSRKDRDLVHEWISGYSSDLAAYTKLAPRLEIQRGRNLNQLLNVTEPVIAENPRRLATFDEIMNRKPVNSGVFDDDDDGAGPSDEDDNEEYIDDMYEPPDTYEEEKPEKNDIFHESAPPPAPDEKNLEKVIAVVNRTAAYGGFYGAVAVPHIARRHVPWGAEPGAPGFNSRRKRKNVFSGQRDSYEREYVTRPDPYDPLLSWEQNQEVRFKKNMISSDLLKKHRINVAKKPEEGEGEGDDQ